MLFDTSSDTKEVYIGKTTNIIKRLESHSTNTDKEKWWNVELVFTINNPNDPLEEGDISYLEYLMCKRAKEAGLYRLDWNSQHPHKQEVSEDDKSYLSTVFHNIDILSKSFGFNVFLNVRKHHVEAKNVFLIIRRNSHAKAEYTSQGMLILKGSEVSDLKPLRKFNKTKFQKLVTSNIIKNGYFTVNYLASSPSTASSLILKAPSDGWTEWKKIGKDYRVITLGEVYR